MLDRLCFLAQNGRWPMLTGWLHDPSQRLLETARIDDSAEDCARLKRLLAPRPALMDLLEIRLAADWLLAPETFSPALVRWLENVGAGRWLAPGAATPAGRWLAVPVLFTDAGGEATVRYFVAGRLPAEAFVPLLPSWAQKLCDPSARAAMDVAASLAATPGWCFHLFPLMAPGNGIAVCGPSLGLPLAMALRQLGANGMPTVAVAATGVLTPKGELKPVSGLREKGLAAWRHRFRQVVCPAANRLPKDVSALEWLP
ncbi:MAG: S16 family serine protease, partial [Desulfosarcinaceae bacterium]